ncbi:pyridine nucleotide-disulfide oxidoreductase [Melghirimyces profundicolus]|uniref:Pyridine nucleotide-disulfide oxidoreductase n=1 Tax=Melghirimyces profundicolus TaxID=1242148 RepID=A0A2T6C2B9_9BACL|nr:NAD(P)/FAD-dependent oxidoreductase [Melghirimyces profundicolus]PTX62472.1 pyridine nucleotide-disulfide oxidoreductase [Melghirimyces profundicolus]
MRSFAGQDSKSLFLDSSGTVPTNTFGQSDVPHLYVAGDARQTHSAVFSMMEGRTAVLHAMGRKIAPPDYRSTPLSFNDHPQAAAVGDLADGGDNVREIILPLSRNFRSCLFDHEEEGFLKLRWNQEGRLTGASAVGERVAEALTPLGLAIRMRIPLKSMTEFFGAHPSTAEFPFHVLRSQGWLPSEHPPEGERSV